MDVRAGPSGARFVSGLRNLLCRGTNNFRIRLVTVGFAQRAN